MEKISDKEQYSIMIDNNKEFVIEMIIEKNNELTNLEFKVELLEDRINKAIEYINNHFLYHYGSEEKPIVFEDDYIQEIIDILRGEE